MEQTKKQNKKFGILVYKDSEDAGDFKGFSYFGECTPFNKRRGKGSLVGKVKDLSFKCEAIWKDDSIQDDAVLKFDDINLKVTVKLNEAGELDHENVDIELEE